MTAAISYQLDISLAKPVCLAIGKFGVFDFPAGRYIYTGSAKRNMDARIARHLSHDKKPKWHIDYLLASPFVSITNVNKFEESECMLNQHTLGDILMPHFGSTECVSGCGSHLKYLSSF